MTLKPARSFGRSPSGSTISSLRQPRTVLGGGGASSAASVCDAGGRSGHEGPGSQLLQAVEQGRCGHWAHGRNRFEESAPVLECMVLFDETINLSFDVVDLLPKPLHVGLNVVRNGLAVRLLLTILLRYAHRDQLSSSRDERL